MSVRPRSPESVRERIVKLRSLSGLTQSDFARACGIARAYIGLIESGARKEIGQSKLIALALATGVSLDYLLLKDCIQPSPEEPSSEEVRAAVARALRDPDGIKAAIDHARGVERTARARRSRRAPPPKLRAKPLRRLPPTEARPS